jgi:microcystin-dependent protein
VLARVLAIAGWGAGLSNFGLATWHGAEFVGLGLNNLPAHTHSFGVPAHTHTVPGMSGGAAGASGGDRTYPLWGGGVQTGAGGGFSGNSGSAGSGEAHFNIQPTCYINVMIKL